MKGRGIYFLIGGLVYLALIVRAFYTGISNLQSYNLSLNAALNRLDISCHGQNDDLITGLNLAALFLLLFIDNL